MRFARRRAGERKGRVWGVGSRVSGLGSGSRDEMVFLHSRFDCAPERFNYVQKIVDSER